MFRFSEIIYLVMIFFFSIGLTYLYKKWAIRRSVMDVPNERSSHEIPVPRGGGIAIVIVFYLGLLLLFLQNLIEKKLFYALLPGLLLAIIGFIDDFRSLSAALRFSVQFVAAGVSLIILGGFHGPFEGVYNLLWSLLALIGLIWFINLFNFLDGSDGYASMEAIAVSLALFVFTGSYVLLILAVSVGGFLYWNWPKAKIFMGDVGSTVLGFVIGVVGISLSNTGTLDIFFWLLLTMLFWFDATVTLIRRVLNREKLSQAHKKHMYQRIIQGGFSHLVTMLFGLGLNVILFIICYLVLSNRITLLFGFSLAILVFILVMRYVDFKHDFSKS